MSKENERRPVRGKKEDEDQLKTLLRDYDRHLKPVKKKLRELQMSPKKGNPLGDYAEWLFAYKKGYDVMPNSNAGYDVIENRDDGRQELKFQVKSRRLSDSEDKAPGEDELGEIGKKSLLKFHFLIGMQFDERYEVVRAYCIPRNLVKDKKVSKPLLSKGEIVGWKVYLKDKLGDVKGIVKMDSDLKCPHNGDCSRCRGRAGLK